MRMLTVDFIYTATPGSSAARGEGGGLVGRVQWLFKRAGSTAHASGAGSSIFARLLARATGFWSICASQHAIEG